MILRHGLTPRVKPVGPRKSSIVSVLDIGTNKVVCLVARLDPMEANASLRGRTHMGQILGIGLSGGEGRILQDRRRYGRALSRREHQSECGITIP